MPRARRDVKYEASTDTYRELFRRGVELDKERSRVQRQITAFNADAERQGAHSGALALGRRLRRIADLERRRLAVREYARVLVDLEDEILAEEAALGGHNGGPALGEAKPVPFEQRRTVAA